MLGGGYVGIETAQTFRRLGSRVTIIEPGRQPMGREDRDVTEEIQAILTGEGVEVVLNGDPERVRGLSGDAVSPSQFGRRKESERSRAATSSWRPGPQHCRHRSRQDRARSPELHPRQRATSDDRSRDLGDSRVRGQPPFTHISVDDFRIVAANMAGGDRRTDDRQVPYVMFTDPPLARVRLSEAEAQRQGVPVRVGRLPMRQVLRTEATDEKTGFHEGGGQRER